MLKVSAYDGDYANPRKLKYGFTISQTKLSESSVHNFDIKLTSYFQMNPDTGVLSLRKDVQVSQFQTPVRGTHIYIYIIHLGQHLALSFIYREWKTME